MKNPKMDYIVGKINADSTLAWASDEGVSSYRTPGGGAGDVTIYLPPGFKPMMALGNSGNGNAGLVTFLINYSGSGPATVRTLQMTSSTLAGRDDVTLFAIFGMWT
jgi:hypothetical protein